MTAMGMPISQVGRDFAGAATIVVARVAGGGAAGGAAATGGGGVAGVTGASGMMALAPQRGQNCAPGGTAAPQRGQYVASAIRPT